MLLLGSGHSDCCQRLARRRAEVSCGSWDSVHEEAASATRRFAIERRRSGNIEPTNEMSAPRPARAAVDALRTAARALGIRSLDQTRCKAPAQHCPSDRSAPVATDADRCSPARGAVERPPILCEPVSTVDARSAADHAAALLGWLQGPGG